MSILSKNIHGFTNFNLIDSAPNFRSTQPLTQRIYKLTSCNQSPDISISLKLRYKKAHSLDHPTLKKIKATKLFLQHVRKNSMLDCITGFTELRDPSPIAHIESKRSQILETNTEDMKIKLYLNYLQKNQRQSKEILENSMKIIENTQLQESQLNKIKKTTIKKLMKKNSILDEYKDDPEKQSPSIKDFQLQTESSLRQTFNNDSRKNIAMKQSRIGVKQKTEILSVFASHQRLITDQQALYESRHHLKIISLRETVKKLMLNINSLSQYLNNSKKLYNVIKKLIFLNKSLKMILLNENGSQLIDPLNEQRLMKNLQRKEQVAINGLNVSIFKYDFSLQVDLQRLSESIQEFILQKKVNAYEIMENKIIAESRSVQQIEAKILSQQHQKVELNVLFNKQKLLDINTYVPVRAQEFSFKSPPMMQYNPHNSLESIEQHLGETGMVSYANRTVGKSIEKLIQQLDQFSQQINENLVKVQNEG